MNLRPATLLLGVLLTGGPAPDSAPAAPDAISNPHRSSAGTLRNGVLSVSLVVQMARWHPFADDGPALPVEAFGEEGKVPSVPGPLIRAPLGTRIEIQIRNALPDTFFYAGGCGIPCKAGDSVRIAPGATGHVSLTLPTEGTFTYYGARIQRGELLYGGAGGQLVGIVVMDSGPAIPERILAITTYEKGPEPNVPGSRGRIVMAINGKSWPFTERLTYTAGDSVHWRVVHLGGGEHPMHLHGFYFRIEARGDGNGDHPIAPASQPLGVTEEIGTLSTARIAWIPDRAGNWLFHCHKPFHTAPERSDAYEGEFPRVDHAHHAETGMGGLVLGITVLPARSGFATANPPAAVNRMRLLVHRQEHYYGREPAYGFVLQEGDSVPARDSVLVPGPTLLLTRGEPAEITVLNQTDALTAVHWHGIELESYFDGVAGWSGAGRQLARPIAPGDSFVARFTPPRAGTFIYHTHVDDLRQLARGLYGGLIVLEPGQRWNDTTDHLFAIGQAGYNDPGWTVVNGVPTSPTETWQKGVTHRLRVLSMTIDEESDVVIEGDKGVSTWTPVARDGTPLPAALTTPGEARLHIGPGQTFDFEWKPEPGLYRMRVGAVTNVLVTIRVR